MNASALIWSLALHGCTVFIQFLFILGFITTLICGFVVLAIGFPLRASEAGSRTKLDVGL